MSKMTGAPSRKENLKIILDSNALFVPLQFGIDIFTEIEKVVQQRYELVLLSPVKCELDALSKKAAPKIRKNASYALKLAEKCRFIKIQSNASTTTDDIILKTATEWRSPVFTNDRQLRKRLRDISMPVIYVRHKSRLEIDGMI